MAKGYWIANVTINDVDEFKIYQAAVEAVFTDWGGVYLMRGGDNEIVEGTSAYDRHVVVEFDSYQHAKDCYNSDAYAAAAAIRQRCADTNLVIVEGYDGATRL